MTCFGQVHAKGRSRYVCGPHRTWIAAGAASCETVATSGKPAGSNRGKTGPGQSRTRDGERAEVGAHHSSGGPATQAEELAASPFRSNWVTGCQVFVVLHSIPVPLEIVCGIADGFPLLSLQTILGRLVPQTSDHVFRVCRVRLTTCVRAALVVTSIDPLSDALA